jgi:hypothetical protein
MFRIERRTNNTRRSRDSRRFIARSKERSLSIEFDRRVRTDRGCLDGTDNEDELRITEMPYDGTGVYPMMSHVARAPVFLQSLMPIISQAGDIVTLKCAATGAPTPSASWSVFVVEPTIDNVFVVFVFRYKNGQEIQPGGRYSVFTDQNSTYSLVISDALPQDSGAYEIIVRNQHGTANSKTNLQILGKFVLFDTVRTAFSSFD